MGKDSSHHADLQIHVSRGNYPYPWTNRLALLQTRSRTGFGRSQIKPIRFTIRPEEGAWCQYLLSLLRDNAYGKRTCSRATSGSLSDGPNRRGGRGPFLESTDLRSATTSATYLDQADLECRWLLGLPLILRSHTLPEFSPGCQKT